MLARVAGDAERLGNWDYTVAGGTTLERLWA